MMFIRIAMRSLLIAVLVLSNVVCTERTEVSDNESATLADTYFATRFQDDCKPASAREQATLRACRIARNDCWNYDRDDAHAERCYADYQNCISTLNLCDRGPKTSEDEVVFIDAGHAYTCAVMKSGKLRCWGENNQGQLGYGHTKNIGDDETPASVGDVPVEGFVIGVATGEEHACALLNNGEVKCWGGNKDGQLGYGHKNSILSAKDAGAVNLGEPATQIVGGWFHTCAILKSGDVKCWGSGYGKELGYDHRRNIGDDETPNSEPSLKFNEKVIQLSAGFGHSCALLESGNLKCWGFNEFYNVGISERPGAYINFDEPETLSFSAPATSLSTDLRHNCVTLNDGNIHCFGININGELGASAINENADAVGLTYKNLTRPFSLGEKAIAVSAAHHHTCAIVESGRVACWGKNPEGLLGYLTNDSPVRVKPSNFIQLGEPAKQLASGVVHTCALLQTGKVKCWGRNDQGQLGYGNPKIIGDDETPGSAGYVPVF